MLGRRMSNQDEDEVEDELDALEAEVSGVKLPDAPTEMPRESQKVKEETPRERARRRAREQAEEQTAQPILA